MSTTGLDAFDRTVQTTNIWLHEIIDDLGPDHAHAWHVLGGVLRALRDQLPAELAAHFAAQLPLLVRGAFYEAWNPGSQSRKAKNDEEFLAKIEENLRGTRPTNGERAAHSVFAVLARHVDREQLATVRTALSEKVRRLWPEALLSPPEGRRAPAGRHAQIRDRAYEIWERMGRPEGDEMGHWLQAEREVDDPQAAGAGKAKPRAKAPATPRAPAARTRRGT